MFLYLLLHILLQLKIFQEVLSEPKHNLRIVGGTEAKATDVPYFAQVVHKNNGDLCGGAIISKKCVLTVVNCFNHPIVDYRIQVGSIIKNTGNIYKIHTNYTCNNIAILITSIEIILRDLMISSVKLPNSKREWSPDIYATVSGFGVLSRGQSLQKRLYYAKVKIFKYDICGMKLQTSISNDLICAGYIEGEIDACSGDLGGPLVSEENELIGLALGPFGCGARNKPSVYVDIVSALDCLQSKLDSYGV